jgi:ribokinase
MGMAAKVVVLGNINQDFVVRAERMPRPGETILGSDVKFVAGGKGANQAVTAARLGAQVTLIGRVGQDAFGPTLLDNLRREGVETRYVGSDDNVATGMAFIALAPDGQNSILSVGGANLECVPRYIDDAAPVIRQADVALVQFAVPLPSVELFVEIAAKAQVPVVMDPTPAMGTMPANWAQSAVLTPNETEAEYVVGHEVPDLAAAVKAAQEIHARGVKIALVKQGAAGCIVCTDEGTRLVPGFKVEVCDTTGAGDSFAAGLGVALAEGLPVDQAVAFANACGALACTKFGAQPSLPHRDAVEAFLSERGGAGGVVVQPM